MSYYPICVYQNICLQQIKPPTLLQLFITAIPLVAHCLLIAAMHGVQVPNWLLKLLWLYHSAGATKWSKNANVEAHQTGGGRKL